MIVTLTVNPSVDRSIDVTSLERGEVNRETGHRVDPGGKGVNVARALAGNGFPTRAIYPRGGAQGQELAALLDHLGLVTLAVDIEEAVRENIAIVEADGTVTKLNAPGPTLSAGEISALLDATFDALDGATWVAACGSLPPAVPDDFYAQLTRRVHARGLRVAIDTSGPALRASLAAGPDVLKPNTEELAEVVGRSISTLGDALLAGCTLLDQGVGTVLATLGADGALLVWPDGVLHATTTVAEPRSTVGAGDAALAGYLAHESSGPEVALRAAAAWGAATVELPGSRMPRPEHIDTSRVEVTDDPDLTLRLGTRPDRTRSTRTGQAAR